MGFILFTDSSCNLSHEILAQRDVHVVPLTYNIGKETFSCYEEGVPFDSKGFFARLRAGDIARTSLINTDTFLRAFELFLQNGQDIVYISISSGISGTYQSAMLAAEELNGKYAAKVYVADSLSAAYGEGLMVLHAADMRDAGESAEDAAEWVRQNRLSMCHFLSVDDLGFLRRGGRLPAMAAAIGTMLNLKPLMFFDGQGRVAVAEKVRGKNRLLREMLKRYAEKALQPDDGTVVIVHGDCAEDAEQLGALLLQEHPNVALTITCIEPTTGAHAGPGALAIIFWGTER
ncbi:MAG: DegV family protein [Christensenellales bacterium]